MDHPSGCTCNQNWFGGCFKGITKGICHFDYSLDIAGWGAEVEPAFVGFINDSVWVVAGFRYQYSSLYLTGKSGGQDISYTALDEHVFDDQNKIGCFSINFGFRVLLYGQ